MKHLVHINKYAPKLTNVDKNRGPIAMASVSRAIGDI